MKKQVFKFLLLIFFSVAFESVSAAILQGSNKEYAGKQIRFYRYTNPVTLQKELAFSVDFDKNGEFKTELSIKRPEYFFSDFGIYRGMLALNPSEDLILRFPPWRKKSFADKKNPYFEPVSFWFATKAGDNITDKIAAFETDFNKLTDQYFNYLYFRQSREVFDSLTIILNQKYPATESEILAKHKSLKLQTLKADAFRLTTGQVSGVIATIDEEFWTFPAFTEFFQKIFSNKLSFEAKTVKGDKIYKAVNQQDVEFLLNLVESEYKLDGNVGRLVLIKMLHDAYYSAEFSKTAILEMLRSSRLQRGAQQTKLLALDVAKKLEFLSKGTTAPVICLKNIDGYRVCSDEFSEKYKYLLFVDTEMIVCREHLKYLSEVHRKFHEQLQIIIVLRKTDLIEMKIFLDQQEVPGVKLVDEDGKYIDEYGVQSFPMAFLLNKNHEVVFEHTRNPLDGFEQQFAPYLRNKMFQDLRNQPR